jgi:Predicted membrane protein (DUF2142)
MTVALEAPALQSHRSLRRLAARRGLLVLVAVLIAEAVWIMAVPPFRGSDEVDHVFRAAGVAHGEWHLSQGTPHGRGLLVSVPDDIVRAAQPQCSTLSYDGRDNCHPVRSADGRSVIATASGAYDPAFYFVVGTAARPFRGAAADYAMRIVTALLCGLLLAAAAVVLTYAGSGWWASLGLLAAMTPEVMFSGAIPAPNGPEMALALLLWCSLLAAVRTGSPGRETALLSVAVAAAVPLTFVRQLGPFWVLAILASVVLLTGVRTARDLASRHRRVMAAGVVLVGLAAAWWAAWQEIAAQVTGESADQDAHRWALAFDLPVFTMQMVGAFPYRDQPAPLAVYPLVFLVVGLLVIAAWRRGQPPRARRAVLWIAVFSLVVPIALSLLLMPGSGAVWQGRYELPYVIGILPLCGLVLDDAGFAPREGPRLVLLSVAALVIAQVASAYHVQHMELGRRVSVSDTSWVHPPLWATAALMALAWGIGALVLRHREHEPVGA